MSKVKKVEEKEEEAKVPCFQSLYADLTEEKAEIMKELEPARKLYNKLVNDPKLIEARDTIKELSKRLVPIENELAACARALGAKGMKSRSRQARVQEGLEMPLPTTSLLDDFDRADNATFGANWTAGTDLSVSANKAVNSVGGGPWCNEWNPSTIGPLSEAYMTLSTIGAGSNVGVAVRMPASAISGYVALYEASLSRLVIYRMVEGVFTLLGAVSQVIFSGDGLGIEAIGNRISLYHKPSAGAWTLKFTVIDNTYLLAGYIGIYVENSACALDDFSGGTIDPIQTRLYLPHTTSGTPISPTPDAAWENTSNIIRCMTSRTPKTNPMTTRGFTDANATLQDILFHQFISPPLVAGQVITGSQTYTAQIRCSETTANNNLFAAFGARIIAADGSTVRKTLLAVTRGGTELATTLVNRNLNGSTAATNYTVVTGDRLVIEVGVGGDPAAGSTHSSSMRFGDAGGSDLPEDNASTSDFNPWFQLLDYLVFEDDSKPWFPPVLQAVNRAATF